MKTAKPKIAIIGTAGLPPQYGGFETLTNYLTIHLRDKADFIVYCPSTSNVNRIDTFNSARLSYLPFKANGLQGIIYDIVAILLSVFTCDRLLILGSGGSVILPLLFPFRHKFVLNFGGLEWKREKWGRLACIYVKFAASLGIVFSDKIIADNQYFVDYIKSEYGKKSYLIEYGGDHCVAPSYCPDNIQEQYSFLTEKYFLSISRSEEDNKIHLLLEAFSGILGRKLVLISNWNASEYGRRLKNKYSGIDNIVLLDAIYDLSVLNQIRAKCHVYIHSHSLCGTAPSLVEIMYLGKPVFSFSAPTNLETTERQALYFDTHEDIKKLVDGTPESTLMELGDKMKEIASRRYTWEMITSKYYECLV